MAEVQYHHGSYFPSRPIRFHSTHTEFPASQMQVHKSAEGERSADGERMLVAINADDKPFFASFDAGCAEAEELLSGETHAFSGGRELPAYSAMFWRCHYKCINQRKVLFIA